ncbi:arabinosyltransferase domain-containing protein [Tomitella gaofuii]|uniref:arabinosyltransferase domain-containing protein n=1 Tax=Tomitella gaofuii TaxID=2760083 RepID=UPI0015F99EC9
MPTAVTDNDKPPSDEPRADARRRLRTARLLAAVTGLAGFVLALLIPLLPVTQTTVHLNWPQNASLNPVSAPAVGYQPITLDTTIPCTAIADLAERDGTAVALSTAPASAGADAHARGLFVTVDDGSVQVRTRNHLVVQAPVDAVAAPGACSELTIDSNPERTVGTFTGLTNADGTPVTGTVSGDVRPQIVGVYTDLTGAVPQGLHFSAEIDSRYSTTPTLLKGLAMIFAVLLTISSLVALSRFDAVDGRKHRRFLPSRWWRFDLKDLLVIGVLVIWHFIGANTADDGYIMTMARAAEHSGYMSNYYRWFAAPEAPFGMSYYMFTALSHISTASPLLRLPALIAGILCWMVISREVIPRLGRLARRRSLVTWTAGLVFLAFWMPFNNGLRPEPYIALGALLTWCSVERAIATRRVLPIAAALLIASFTLSVGPTGTICIAALIAGSRPMLQIIIGRAKQVGWLATLGPLLASGTVVLVLVFGDTTIKSVLQATDMKTDLGPSEEWYMEYLRYEALMTFSPDGSISRRFAVFSMLLCLIVCAAMLYRKRAIPGVALGPSRRIVGITAMSLALMMFNPTKWSHHFGVYAGLAGALAALTTLAILSSALRSGRNRALFVAALMFVMAISFESSNSWWYVSNYGIPWGGEKPQLAGIAFADVFIALTVLSLLVALYLHYREPYILAARARGEEPRTRRLLRGRFDGLLAAPLTVTAAFMVLIETLSMAAGMAIQYPAYTVGKGNLRALTGNPCAQGDQILVEPDANAGMLTPIGAEPAAALSGFLNENFGPNGIPTDLTSDKEYVQPGVVGTGEQSNTKSNSAGTGGGLIAEPGINGSLARLPFGLNPDTTPVIGSFHTADQPISHAVSSWYQLPPRADDQLLVISAAGRINPANFQVLFGTTNPDGSVTAVGSPIAMMDTGPDPSWRNLRLPMERAPKGADAVQILAYDSNPALNEWLAFTPPRIAQLETMQSYVGSTTPVLLDWAVALAFPCLRPFNHLNGIAEIPKFRVLPDRGLAVSSTNTWQDAYGGGPLGWTGLLLTAETVPAYQDNDWGRDWGSLEKFSLRVPDSTVAELDLGTATRSGLWSPGPIRHGWG